MFSRRPGEGGADCARSRSLDPVLTKNLLDGGVRSLMYPFVQTGEEAEQVVAMTRYPPDGVRGVAGWNRG